MHAAASGARGSCPTVPGLRKSWRAFYLNLNEISCLETKYPQSRYQQEDADRDCGLFIVLEELFKVVT
jgi:hypothetical protein